MTQSMKPGELGTRDGKPAIVWWRYGVAARGEPSTVQEVRTYSSEAERYQAFQSAREDDSGRQESTPDSCSPSLDSSNRLAQEQLAPAVIHYVTPADVISRMDEALENKRQNTMRPRG